MADAVQIMNSDVEEKSAESLLTLDEPVYGTLWRDLRSILLKLVQVIAPCWQRRLLDWDLWGPLVICLCLAGTLSFTAPSNQTAKVFSLVFVCIVAGSILITLNALLLGGKVSFLQTVCVLGYSVFPLLVAAVVLLILKSLAHRWVWLRCAVAFPLLGWSIFASYGLFTGVVKTGRKALVIFPLCLFFLVITWLIVVQEY